MEVPAINPKLIHLFHRDLSAAELAEIRKALDKVPGSPEGRKELWAKFEKNLATILIRRNVGGSLNSFTFFEVLEEFDGAKQFNLLATFALHPSRDLTETAFPQFEVFARMLNCSVVRVQTVRAGLVRKLSSIGYTLCPQLTNGEFVLRKNL